MTFSAVLIPKEGKKKDLSFLESLPGAAENLRVFTADLSDPDSFTEAIGGCNGVFHLAMPMDGEPEPAVNKLTVDATLGILRASLESKTVRRVVYTSSAAAVVGAARVARLVDESSWTDVDRARCGRGGASAVHCRKDPGGEKGAGVWRIERTGGLVNCSPLGRRAVHLQ